MYIQPYEVARAECYNLFLKPIGDRVLSPTAWAFPRPLKKLYLERIQLIPSGWLEEEDLATQRRQALEDTDICLVELFNLFGTVDCMELLDVTFSYQGTSLGSYWDNRKFAQVAGAQVASTFQVRQLTSKVVEFCDDVADTLEILRASRSLSALRSFTSSQDEVVINRLLRSVRQRLDHLHIMLNGVPAGDLDTVSLLVIWFTEFLLN